MSNRYDAITPREAAKIPSFSPHSKNQPAPIPSITATHLRSSGPAGYTQKGPADPGTIATQSSASYNHIAQRFMGNGQTDFSREMQGGPPGHYPREPYVYQVSYIPLRARRQLTSLTPSPRTHRCSRATRQFR